MIFVSSSEFIVLIYNSVGIKGLWKICKKKISSAPLGAEGFLSMNIKFKIIFFTTIILNKFQRFIINIKF